MARMATKAGTLYEDDFFAWTQEQASVLRTQFRGDNRLDVEHLAEEIEELGRSELHAVESFVEQIIAHLLKLDFSGVAEPRAHWRMDIVAFRTSLDRKLTPSIKRKVRSSLSVMYGRAVDLAAAALHQAEPDFRRRLPRSCPYDWGTIVGRDVFAGAERPR
jgi:hypothetical protein